MTIYPNNFVIVKFYGYPSYQHAILNEYDECENYGDKSVKRFFEEILKQAEESLNQKLMDNKVVFELRLKGNTNTVIYCGYKDNKYRISFGMTTETYKVLDVNN